MSAPSCIIFFGISFNLAPDEIEAIETRSDPRIESARRNKLDYHYGSVATPAGPQHRLYVGRKLAVSGPENPYEKSFTHTQLMEHIAETITKLTTAGWRQAAELSVSFEPD